MRNLEAVRNPNTDGVDYYDVDTGELVARITADMRRKIARLGLNPSVLYVLGAFTVR
jgi:hypothetical protein